MVFDKHPCWREWGRDQTMLCCVPLRTGVFLNAFFTMLVSIFMIASKEHTEEFMRKFSGGYALTSRVVIGFIEVTGVLWGIMGIMGTVLVKNSYIRVYNWYQIVRVCAWFGMYYSDVPLLLNCELWRSDITKAIKLYGWNPVMYNIAMGNECYQERMDFLIFSFISLLFFIYLITCNMRLQATLEQEPRYLLRVPKETPMGSFYTESIGAGGSVGQAPSGADVRYGSTGPQGKSTMAWYDPYGHAAPEDFDPTQPVGPPVRAPRPVRPTPARLQTAGLPPGYQNLW